MSVSLAESRTTARPLPVWPVVMLIIAVWWFMMYLDQHRGWWFDLRVYTPYSSFAEVAAMWPTDSETARLLEGQKLFHASCAICHQDNGTGNQINGCPP